MGMNLLELKSNSAHNTINWLKYKGNQHKLAIIGKSRSEMEFVELS